MKWFTDDSKMSLFLFSSEKRRLSVQCSKLDVRQFQTMMLIIIIHVKIIKKIIYIYIENLYKK